MTVHTMRYLKGFYSVYFQWEKTQKSYAEYATMLHEFGGDLSYACMRTFHFPFNANNFLTLKEKKRRKKKDVMRQI